MKYIFKHNLLICFKFTLLLLTILQAAGKLQAQAGNIDTTFNRTDNGLGFGDGANTPVYAMAIQPNGKILIGGNFTTYNGKTQNRLARLNADGTLDATFSIGTGFSGIVYAIAVQTDGRILIGGAYSLYNGAASNFVTRLNANGTVDSTFTSGSNNTVNTIAVQPDGKILIGGDFTTYNATSINRVARLNANGTLDGTFTPGTGASNSVYRMALQTDGKILVGGAFTSYNSVAKNYITRINADGTLDGTFNSGTGANNLVNAVAVAGNGKILVGGDFTTYNGTTAGRLVQLNTNGTVDGTFSSGAGPNGSINTISIQSDSKIVIGGIFDTYNGVSRLSVARLNASGTVDTTFTSSPNNRVQTSAIQTDGKVLIGGLFTSNNTISSNFVARLNTDGILDANFNPGTGASSTVNTITMQSDGKILIGGIFSFFNGMVRNRIARLNSDGTLDATFNPGNGANTTVLAIAVQTDGKILIGGQFTIFNGTASKYITRLNSDGTLDSTFNSGTAALATVNAVVIQPDGKILIGGLFTSYNGVARNRIARLNADGTLDLTFNPGTGAGSTVTTIALQPDGKILIGGTFTTFNSIARNRIARLNADGSLDATFNPGTGANSTVNTLVLQPDGRILFGGAFTSYNGTARNALARVNADGTMDTTFSLSATTLNGAVTTMLVQPDGRVLIAGGFTTYNSTSRIRVARLNADGTLDTGFDPGLGTSGTPNVLARQANGKILIGGAFTSYNGIGRNRLAGIQDGSTPLPVTFTGISAYRQGTGIVVEWHVQQEEGIQGYAVERSEDGSSFSALGITQATGSPVYRWTDLDLTAGQVYYYRIRVMEKTGSTKYSNIVKVSASTAPGDFAAYPNPIQGGSFQLAFGNQPSGVYLLSLFNVHGQVVHQVSISHAGGGKTETILLPNDLQKGQYFLEITRTGGERKVLRMAY